MRDVKPAAGRGSTESLARPAARFATDAAPPLARRLLAEAVGTALLVTVVVGSGIAAAKLSPNDAGLQLLENSTATVLGLTVLILQFGPVSGAHFNPVVSLTDWLLGHRSGHGLPLRDVGAYALARTAGAVAGAHIGATYWYTSSTSFANPAVTVGRIFSDTFAGIAPVSVLPFVATQLISAGLGAALVRALYPDVGLAIDDVVVAHLDLREHP
jgi:glycerol uptake facilitator-like aquaporin